MVVANCGWCWSAGAKKGDGIIRIRQGNNGGAGNLILSTTGSNAGKYIAFADGSGIWVKAQDDRTFRVGGKIFAKEIEVKTNVWADFVFEDTYKLKPLSEVETFIKENKHLPEVPSETEVLDKGIDVAKMDALLLQKIEELTLYMIELKKENQEMKSEIELLKK